MESINYMGLLIFVYFVAFAFEGGQMFAMKYYFYWMFNTIILLGVNLVMVQYKMGRVISFWLTTGYITLIFTLGMIYASKKQIVVCYIPLLIEGVILGIALTLVYFRVPERWCQDVRFVQLYLNSYVIYSILFINFVFEIANILFLTLKLNDGTLTDELYWYEVSNIYND